MKRLVQRQEENDHETYAELLGAFRKDDRSKPVAYDEFVEARTKKKKKKTTANEECWGCIQSLGGKIMDTKTRDLYTVYLENRLCNDLKNLWANIQTAQIKIFVEPEGSNHPVWSRESIEEHFTDHLFDADMQTILELREYTDVTRELLDDIVHVDESDPDNKTFDPKKAETWDKIKKSRREIIDRLRNLA